jgi:hypothetical protein
MFDKPNWQDTFLGGTILVGFVLIAIFAAVLTMISPSKIARLTSPTVGAAIKLTPFIPPR